MIVSLLIHRPDWWEFESLSTAGSGRECTWSYSTRCPCYKT